MIRQRPQGLPLTLVFALPLMMLLLSACPQTPQESTSPQEAVSFSLPPMPSNFQGEERIAVIAPLSGESAQLGQAMAAGANFATDEINRQGGLSGKRLRVESYNSASLEQQQQALQDLNANRNGLRAVFVLLSVESAQNLLEALSGLNVPVLVSGYRDAEPRPSLTNVYYLDPEILSEAEEIAKIVAESKASKSAVVFSDDLKGRALRDAFTAKAQSYGVGNVHSFALDPFAVSYQAEATALRELNPRALFFAGSAGEAPLFFAQLFGFEFQGSVYVSSRARSFSVIDELGCSANGMNFASSTPMPASVLSGQQLAHFAEISGRSLESESLSAYAMMQVIEQASQQANSYRTVLGDFGFEGSRRSNSELYFFQADGKAFRESFAQTIGQAPRLSQESGGQGYLTNASFSKPELVLAGLNWEAAAFHNAVARYIIELGFGYPTVELPGSSVPLFQSLRQGEVDIYMEAWLPNAQELYNNALAQGQILDLGINYSDARQGWWVPRYMLEGRNALTPELKSVEDLPNYAQHFASPSQPATGRLIDGAPGWFSSKIDCMKLKAYQLDDKFQQVLTGSESALFAEVSSAYTSQQPVVFYAYEPTWPLAAFDLVRLEEPAYSEACWADNKRCAFPPSEVRILGSSDLNDKAPEVVAFLQSFGMDTAEVSQILLEQREEGYSSQELAKNWLKTNDRWHDWLPADVLARVQAAL